MGITGPVFTVPPRWLHSEAPPAASTSLVSKRTQPKVTFACYFPAGDPLFVPVNIESGAWVGDLLKAIEVELQSLGREVSRKDLRLSKTDVGLKPTEGLQLRALQWLHEQSEKAYLQPLDDLASIFPDGPCLTHNKLDIIVADAEVLELMDGLGDPDDVYKRKVKKALDESLNCLTPTPSPSEIIQSSQQQAQILGGDKPAIHLGRLGGVPATIFVPALAMLQHCLDHLEQIRVYRPEVKGATKYLRYAAAFYDNEDLRQKAIKDLVDGAIGEAGEWGRRLDWADNIKPEGGWWYDTFLILVLELKNALGLSGDALLQAVIDYSKIVVREKYVHFRNFCNFPIVLVGATANRLEISVAVCVGSVYVSKLLTLDLSLGFHASDNIIRLACVFKALSICREDLKNYYDGVRKSDSPKLSCLYPNPTHIDPLKALPKLTYRQFLSRAGQPTSTLVDLGNTTMTMYTATLGDNNEEVIVKFTGRYNAEAHQL